MQGIMRSLTSCEATGMEQLFWFSLLLSCLTVIDSLKKADCYLSQPNSVIWQKIGQSAVLPCTPSSHCSTKDWQYEWFSFKEKRHIRLKVLENPEKYRLEGASLHINSLHMNDSGIYHCAAVFRGAPAKGRQHVGPGTTLVVRDKRKISVSDFLWSAFALLVIYSLAIVTLIVKKYGCKRSHQINKHNLTKKTQFRDVLQELHRQKNKERSKQAVRKSSSHAEAAGIDLNGSTDDIYQNV